MIGPSCSPQDRPIARSALEYSEDNTGWAGHRYPCEMSAGADRKRAARERLSERRGEPAPDAELAGEALAKVRGSVEQRDPPDEETANQIASEEIRQMREEKRERDPIFNR